MRNNKSDPNRNQPTGKNRFDYEDPEDLKDRQTQLNIKNKIVSRLVENLLGNIDLFINYDRKYWRSLDRYAKYLEVNARKSAGHFWLFLSMCGNYIIDFVLFHSLVKYLMQLGVPNCPELLLIAMAIFFPIFYLFGEVELNQKICTSKRNMDDDSEDIGAKLWFCFWCLMGTLYALFPSAGFAYVMQVAQAETSQSPFFIVILSILGIVIHMFVIFGGRAVIDFKTWLWANFWHGRDRATWLKWCRKMQILVTRLKKATISHARSLSISDFEQGAVPIQLSSNVLSIVKFFDEGWYRCHPLDRPEEFRFGYGSGPYDRRDRHDDDDPRLNG
jgi:hypothetical protein